MEIETRAEEPKNFDVSESIDIDPRNPLVIEVGEQFLGVVNRALFEIRAIVFDQRDDGAAGVCSVAWAQHTW